MAASAQTTPGGETRWFRSHPQRFADLGTVRIAYRTIGSGPPLLLVHGWPFSSLSFRKLVPLLCAEFTCVLPDTPGLGDTEWGPRTPFRFVDQAETLRAFATAVGLRTYAVLAHDTGATIARQLSLIDDRVRMLALLNTEIPGHRPPWIPLYQRLVALPGSELSFMLLLRSATYRRSGMGYGGCFYDAGLLDDDFYDCFVRPVVGSRSRMLGVTRYLAGIDWGMVDGFAHRHLDIRVPVQLIWGADDPTFPVARARSMAAQFPAGRGLHEIPRARLLVHEERPAEVAAVTLPFLRG